MRTRLTLTAFLLPLTLASCWKDNRQDDILSETIQAMPAFLETKDMLGRSDLLTNGTKVHIVDVLTGFDGKVNGTNWTSGNKYIDDEVIYSGSEVWNFASGSLYPWTASGTHTFRGWLSYDARANAGGGLAASALFGSGLTYSNGVLSVPDTELTTNSPQFDLLYSGIITRDMSQSPRPTGIVPVNLSHLFSALSLSIVNSSMDRVRVTSVSTTGLQNRKSATIDFDDLPLYTTLTPENSFIQTSYTGSEIWFEQGDKYDILTNTRNPRTMRHFLLWPQTAAEMSAARISVEYQIAGDYENDGSTLKTHRVALRFPAGNTMRAGSKYQFILTFSDKRVKLLMVVQPWDYNEYTWNFEDSTISECTQLTFIGESGVDFLQTGKNITFINGKPIHAYFAIKTPKGGQWSLELQGDASDNYITVSPYSGFVNADIENGRVNLTFTPDLSLERDRDITVSLPYENVYLFDGETEKVIKG